MALTINTQAQGGLVAPQVSSGTLPSNFSQPVNLSKPISAAAPMNYGSSIGGLVNPTAHPALGSQSTAPVASHTITTDGQGSTTSKVTYAQPQQGSQPQYSSSGGAVIPTGGAEGTPTGGPAIPNAINQYQAGTPGLFGQITTGLANTASAGSPIVQQAAQGLLSTSAPQNNPLTSGPALNNYNQAVNDLNTLKENIANELGGIQSEAIPLEFQQGRMQAVQNKYASILDAAQQRVNQAQTALGLGIQEQGQQQAGFNQAGTLGNTQQQLAQSGLASAGQLAQPSGNFPFVFNPTTGTFSTGAAGGSSGGIGLTLNPSTDISNAVQSIQSNPSLYNSYASAITSGYGSGGSVIKSQLDAALLKAGLNPTNLAAQSTGAAQNVGTASTAQAGAANTAYQQYYAQALDVNNSLNQVQSLGNLTIQTAQGGSINPFTLQAGNITLQALRNQLSSPAQATFDQSMATFQGALSQLFANSSDVTPTQVSSWSSSIANGTMTIPQLQAIYQQAIKEGNLRLNNILSTGSAAFSQLQSSASGSSSSADPWQ